MPSGELLQQAVRDLEQAELMDMFCPEYKHQYIIWRLGKFIMEDITAYENPTKSKEIG